MVADGERPLAAPRECADGSLRTRPKAAEAPHHPDAFWRQADLERRFETLDQEEHALHQSQMRIFREQMAAFIRDLELVRQDMSAMESEHSGLLELVNDTRDAYSRMDHAHHLAVDRVVLLETSARRSAQECERQKKQLEGLFERCSSTGGRMDVIEAAQGKHASTIEGIMAALGKQSLSLDDFKDDFKAMSNGLHETVTGHREAQKRAEQVQHSTMDRISRLERTIAEMAEQQQELRGKYAEATYVEGLRERLAAVAGHVKTVEASLGGFDGRRAQEIQHMKATQELHITSCAKLEDLHENFCSIASRVACLEKLLSEEKLCDSASRISQEFAGLQAANLRLQAEVTKFSKEEKARTLVQCSLAERLGALEGAIDEKFDRIDSRLSVVRGIWARDREQLLSAHRQVDQITETSRREVRTRAPHSESDTPPPPPTRSISVATLSLRSQLCPRGARAARSTSPRLPCDWDEAIKRMQEEGIVHSGRARVDGPFGESLPAWS
mmetsp:Transcript_24093/g.74902  ORF Transcript_24093/g.74902 Transcript_24093/m.74902 type:complete len:500 (+) Transcript_24093:58-1557(+)